MLFYRILILLDVIFFLPELMAELAVETKFVKMWRAVDFSENMVKYTDVVSPEEFSKLADFLGAWGQERCTNKHREQRKSVQQSLLADFLLADFLMSSLFFCILYSLHSSIVEDKGGTKLSIVFNTIVPNNGFTLLNQNSCELYLFFSPSLQRFADICV